VRALPEIGGGSVVPVLEGLMADSDGEIAQAAQDSFAAIAGPEADAAVVAMLKSNDAARQVAGLDLLSRRRMTKQMPEVMALAGNSTAAANVRSAALRRLGELGTPADLPALLGLLMQSKGAQELDAAEQAVSAVCAKATEPEASVGRVTGLLPQAAPAQKIALVRILSVLGGSSALNAVRSAVGDTNPDVHKAAIRALGQWKTADAAPDLLALARKAGNPTEKMLCLRSYLSLADNPDLPNGERISMCREATSVVESAEEKKLLLAALGSITAANAVPLIVPYLEDPAVRAEAATAVLGITDKVLRTPGSSKVAPKLIEPLEKVAQATAGTDLGKRASAAVEQAKKRAASGR
jgi:HEAT repeat protein